MSLPISPASQSPQTSSTPSLSMFPHDKGSNIEPSPHVQVSEDATYILSDSDDSEDLANRPLDPGDDMYRGKSVGRVVTENLPSPPQTRRRTAKPVISPPEDEMTIAPATNKVTSKRRPADVDISPNSKKRKQLANKVGRRRNVFIDQEAEDADDHSVDGSDSEHSADEDDDSFIDDGTLPPDPLHLYHTTPPVTPSPKTPSTPAQSVLGASKAQSGTILNSPFASSPTTGQEVDTIVQQALSNKDFVAALLRTVAGGQGSPPSLSLAGSDAGWMSSVAHFTANGPSPSHGNPDSISARTIAPVPPTPHTPTKPKTRGRPKGKGKSKGAAAPVTVQSSAGNNAPLTQLSVTNTAASSASSAPTTSTVASMQAPLTPAATPTATPAATAVMHPSNNAFTTSLITPSPSSNSALPPSIAASPTPRMSMADLSQLLPADFQASDEPNSAGYNKGSIRICPPLPAVCEVNDPSLHDPLLAETYAGLVNLKKGRFSSWSSNNGRGQVVFSTWVTKTPSMNPNTVYSIITFSQSGRWINGSRLSPLEVQLREIRQNNTLRYNVYRGDVPAVAMSCGYLWESYVLTPKPYGLSQKMVSVVLHKQEWERLVGFCCMVFNVDVIAAQVYQSALQFSTRSDWNPDQAADSAAGNNGPDSDDHMFTHMQSPATDTSQSSSNAANAMSLSANARIPVFDARGIDFNFQNDIQNLSKLPRFEGEIPGGSFVVVGYTLSAYVPNQKWNLATNLLWVVVVGVPE
ncbi:hypothetical protein CVT24_002704 [Panaeolus cyanescens]|uniref:Uncharacterized protein n=1 Tax=Panaeolus cyanescens TaxID=181874 RepID=A0A409YY88_9AGAR|nr:hypothetical protein CVT24_002704 [Panaeolus cyanescens]